MIPGVRHPKCDCNCNMDHEPGGLSLFSFKIRKKHHCFSLQRFACIYSLITLEGPYPVSRGALVQLSVVAGIWSMLNISILMACLKPRCCYARQTPGTRAVQLWGFAKRCCRLCCLLKERKGEGPTAVDY